MFSVRSCSPEVMNRLTPSMCQLPSSCSVALVRPAPTSEPASGSVSTMVAPQPRSMMWCAIFWSRSVPLRQSTCAKLGPAAYMCTGGLAPSTSSAAAQRSDGGVGWPPSSAGSSSLNHSASM